MTKRYSFLVLLLSCTQRLNTDAGVDAGGYVLDAGSDAGTEVDAGHPLDRFQSPANWLDGGGRLTLLDVWESPLSAHGPCYVTGPGRLFFGSASQSQPGAAEFVFSAVNSTVWVGRVDVGIRPTLLDESYAYCERTGPLATECKRRLVDGGIIMGPPAAFFVTNWTTSGYISGDVRKCCEARCSAGSR